MSKSKKKGKTPQTTQNPTTQGNSASGASSTKKTNQSSPATKVKSHSGTSATKKSIPPNPATKGKSAPGVSTSKKPINSSPATHAKSTAPVATKKVVTLPRDKSLPTPNAKASTVITEGSNDSKLTFKGKSLEKLQIKSSTLDSIESQVAASKKPLMSLWIGSEQQRFTNAVSKLQNLSEIPNNPTTHDILTYRSRSSDPQREWQLDITEEQRLADDLAFLAASQQGAKYVSAVTVEEHRSPMAISIKVSSNDGINSVVIETFKRIFAAIEARIPEGMHNPIL